MNEESCTNFILIENSKLQSLERSCERGSITKSQKGKKAPMRGKWESVFSGHMDNVPEETHAITVMILKSLRRKGAKQTVEGQKSSQ